MRKTALAFLACWAIPALSYELNAIPTINDLHLVDGYRQIAPILSASEVLSIKPGVFSILYGITGLLPILNEPADISRIEQFDVIGPVYGGLPRSQVGQPKVVDQQKLGPLSFADAKI